AFKHCSTAPGRASRRGKAYPRRRSGRPFANEHQNERPPKQRAAEPNAEAAGDRDPGFPRHSAVAAATPRMQRVEIGMFMYTRNASYRLGVSSGCFSQRCGGAPGFVELFAIRALIVLRPLHFSWLLDHWSQPANRLPNLSRDGKRAGGGCR